MALAAPPDILAALAGLAQRWQELAMAWHVYVVALGLAAAFGWRPANRVAALLRRPADPVRTGVPALPRARHGADLSLRRARTHSRCARMRA